MIELLFFCFLFVGGLVSLVVYRQVRKELGRKTLQSRLCFVDLLQEQGIKHQNPVLFVAPTGHVPQLLKACFQNNPFPRYRTLLAVVRLLGIIKLFKREKVLQTPAAAAALSAVGVMASEIARFRQQSPKTAEPIRCNVVYAGIQALRLYFVTSFEQGFSFARFRSCLEVNNAFNGSRQKYKTRDQRYFSFHVYYPEQKRRMVEALHLEKPHDQFTMQTVKSDRKIIEKAVADIDASELEELSFDSGACASVLRTRQEWESSELGQAVGKMPLIKLNRVAPIEEPKNFPAPTHANGPLAGVKVLDLTHIIAGPACTRLLAQYGADVLIVRRGRLKEQIQSFLELDGWAGKRVCHLDFNQQDDLEHLHALIRSADIVVASYQQGAFERFGLSQAKLFELNPKLVLGSLYCFSDTVWRSRPGWAPLAEDITGLSIRNGSPGRPKNLNGVPLDYIPGFVLALGVLQALHRAMTEGGGYAVEVSLTRVAMWLHTCSDRYADSKAEASLAKAEGPLEAFLERIDETAVGPLAFPRPAVTTPWDGDPKQYLRCVDGQVTWADEAEVGTNASAVQWTANELRLRGSKAPPRRAQAVMPPKPIEPGEPSIRL